MRYLDLVLGGWGLSIFFCFLERHIQHNPHSWPVWDLNPQHQSKWVNSHTIRLNTLWLTIICWFRVFPTWACFFPPRWFVMSNFYNICISKKNIENKYNKICWYFVSIRLTWDHMKFWFLPIFKSNEIKVDFRKSIRTTSPSLISFYFFALSTLPRFLLRTWQITQLSIDLYFGVLLINPCRFSKEKE